MTESEQEDRDEHDFVVACVDGLRDDVCHAWDLLYGVLTRAEVGGDAALLKPLQEAEAALQRLLRLPAADEADWRRHPVTGEELAEVEHRLEKLVDRPEWVFLGDGAALLAIAREQVRHVAELLAERDGNGDPAV